MTDRLADAKRRLRTEVLARRQSLDPALGTELAAHVLADCPPPPAAVVAGFWPIRDEIDVRPLLHALHRRGHMLALPVTGRRGEPLVFREWVPGAELVPEPFGTVRSVGAICRPDFLLVPLAAFDRAGGRLGYGGGFYDRTLAGLPGAFRLGCGFAAQEVASVPMGPYDLAMDAVATERGVIFCRGK